MSRDPKITPELNRYIVKNRDGVIVANGVSQTDEEIRQMKSAGYKVKEVNNEH